MGMKKRKQPQKIIKVLAVQLARLEALADGHDGIENQGTKTYYIDDMLIKPGLGGETVRMEKGSAEFFVYNADGPEPAGMLLTVGYSDGPVEVELQQEFSRAEMVWLASQIMAMLASDR